MKKIVLILLALIPFSSFAMESTKPSRKRPFSADSTKIGSKKAKSNAEYIKELQLQLDTEKKDYQDHKQEYSLAEMALLNLTQRLAENEEEEKKYGIDFLLSLKRQSVRYFGEMMTQNKDKIALLTHKIALQKQGRIKMLQDGQLNGRYT